MRKRPAPRPEGAFLESADFAADVLQSRQQDPFWYYIVQPKGSREIVDMKRCNSYDDAVRQARRALDLLQRPAASGK